MVNRHYQDLNDSSSTVIVEARMLLYDKEQGDGSMILNFIVHKRKWNWQSFFVSYAFDVVNNK